MTNDEKVQSMDPFLLKFDSNELRIAAEFLSNWVPFLTRGLCNSCTQTLSDGVRSLRKEGNASVSTPNMTNVNHCKEDSGNCCAYSTGSTKDSVVQMAVEDEPVKEEERNGSNGSVNAQNSFSQEKTNFDAKPKVVLSRDQRESIRFKAVQRIKDFRFIERVDGKLVNILEGLELHKVVFSAAEQRRIVSYVEQLQQMGRAGQLKEHTYTAPHKWMRGKGRVTLQFGCCYNYATDRKGNPPGILKSEIVDPLPPLFKLMIRRLVNWHVLPPSCVPDSCIVNIYDEGDCIPPHIDNHEFVRPFCTVSFLSECDILFGSNLKIKGPGEFEGSYAIPLPLGSVLVLNGNGADVAKHCVPAVPSKRISITFRRMDECKRPTGYCAEPDLLGLQPLRLML